MRTAPTYPGRSARLWIAGPRAVLCLAIAMGVCLAPAFGARNVDMALRSAVQTGNLPDIEHLLQEGADPNAVGILLTAVGTGQLPVLQSLLAGGGDPNAWSHRNEELPRGAAGSPVYGAAAAGNRAMLSALRDHGADFDAESTMPTTTGETALIVAVQSGNLEAARLLLEFGAHADHVNSRGAAALDQWVFATSHAAELVALLLKSGADADRKDASGVSARDQSYTRGPIEVREAIEKWKPLPPFEHPDELFRIRLDLLYKASCDRRVPGFSKRIKDVFAQWRVPRAAAIRRIEADPEYQAKLAEVMRADSHSPTDEEDGHQICDIGLPQEFQGTLPDGQAKEPAPSSPGAAIVGAPRWRLSYNQNLP